MTRTGWIGEDPDEAPPMPLTEMLLDRQQHRARPLETALARSRADDARAAREEAANAPDPDERAANLVSRGYSPGMLFELAQRLGDTQAELEAEREKIERGKRRAETAARAQAAGRVDVFRMQAMLDGDFGDEDRVAMLERQAQSLGRQIAEAQAMIAPPPRRELDPVESAVARAQQAHREYVEVTRAMIAEARERSRPQAPPPFASRASAGAVGAEHTGPDCQICAEGRRRDAARAREDFAAVYAPGEVITTGYQQGIAYR